MPICKVECWDKINERWKSFAREREWRIDVGGELTGKARGAGDWRSNNGVALPAPEAPPHPVRDGGEVFEEKRPSRTELYWDGADYRRDAQDETRYSIQDPWTNFLQARLRWANFP